MRTRDFNVREQPILAVSFLEDEPPLILRQVRNTFHLPPFVVEIRGRGLITFFDTVADAVRFIKEYEA
jgi:hypothetical protein